ncbi:HD domain-containing protein [Actinomadura spongiicola]|uniref:HD domain-containing protein n=1 Tax=Actinomadura spongiicola TaxID=2303421 RepID=UPI0011C18800|nr:caspase family protein [Actinomadura spongiicola]
MRSDVHRMEQALAQSDYEVRTVGLLGGKDEATLSRVKREIKQACAQVPRGGVLLVYFSGHGVSVDGRDFFVPSDAHADDPGDLVPVIPAELTGCQARLVVFFVDACRDHPARETVPAGGHVPFPSGGSFVLVNGCEAGQRCHYTENGSVFTQALAQVLDRRHHARTLGRVIEEVTQEVRRRASRNEDLRQSPSVPHPSMLADAKDVVVCEGDELAGAWQRAAESADLWQCCGQKERRLEAAQRQVLTLVEGCARRWRDAYETLRSRTGIEDPWFDQNYPVRVLEGVARLLGERRCLTAAEAAVLVAAPFLREVVLAEGIRLAAGIQPTNFTRTYKDGARTDLELTHEQHQQMIRRAEGLERRGLIDGRDALAMWLVHQWLATRQSVWRDSAAHACYRDGARLLEREAWGLAGGEIPNLMETLLRAVGAHPADSIVLDGLSAPYVDDRWRVLASLLWLGGILAADLRRMPPVLADHIGTRMELPLSTVKNTAAQLRWERRGDQLDLRMSCHHPAQYAVFRDVLKRAAEAHERIAKLPLDEEIAAALPAGFIDKSLRPETRPDKTLAFQVPLSRFRLAEDKIRELLMGRQLYDDPSLAIRELYQNALDACRYRDVRLQGLGKAADGWSGLIRFRQQTDEDGREFIECQDNGVGMDIDTLERVFASAGERFVYKESFRSEQARWQMLTPPLQVYSNSQFGVGVFSYFMLADEITVVTRPVDGNGDPGREAYRVDIASSGSLFHVTSADDQLRDGGTCVRLYLSTDEDERVSALLTLRKLLWISDYRVEAAGESSTERWEPHELRYPDETVESLRCGDDLWWVSDEGGLAADGIRTNEEIFGLIVNLHGTHRPRFTVDRTKLREWHKDWVREEIDKSLPELLRWPGLTLSWLWQVAKSAPEVAQQIFVRLVEEDVHIPIGTSWGQDSSISVRNTGCLPQDQELFGLEAGSRGFGRWFDAWRSGQWRSRAATKSGIREHPAAVASGGFPIVDPNDAQMLAQLSHWTRDEHVPIDKILEVLAHPEQTMADRLRRLRRYVITGIDISAVRHCPPLPVTCKEENPPPVRAFAAWTPPGAPPRRCVAGWLIKTSQELDRTLGEVLGQAAALMPADWTAPDIDLGPLADYTCGNADANLVSVALNGGPPWIEDALGPAHLVEAATTLGRELDKVLLLCDKLAPLGVTVAGREKYRESLSLLEIEALRQIRVLGEPLSPLQLVVVAGRSGHTIRETHRCLADLEKAGFLVRPDMLSSNALDTVPGPGALRFIDIYLQQYRRSVGRKRWTATKPCLPITFFVQGRRVLQRYASWAREVLPFGSPEAPVTYPELVGLAGSMYCTVGEARAAILRAFPDAEVPEPRSEIEDLAPLFEISLALVNPPTWWAEKPMNWHLTAKSIVEGAFASSCSLGEFLQMLLPYREVGAPVPQPDESTLEALCEIYPDEYDEDMLTAFDEDWDEVPVSEFDALQLVRTAGRLGWAPAEAQRRLARLAAIGVTLSYPVNGCHDDVVRWQDLLLLTEHNDGYAPAISGCVSPEHVARAAEETGEPAEWIMERLRLYAPLFELDLGNVDRETSVA